MNASSSELENHQLRLSICMATYNRGPFIGETLDSILEQMEPGIELVIVDGASPDNTPDVMRDYVSRYPDIRYVREQENSGVDADYDKAVGYAKGEYCWLMTDDDLLRPGAVRKVMLALEGKFDLVIVNAQIRNADMSEMLLERRHNIAADREYGDGDQERFFIDTASYLGFIGGVVIKRSFWKSRDRQTYYGSLFIHVGVIFQHPPAHSVRVLANPLIEIRNGNAMWTPRSFEIWTLKWPMLIWSFTDFSETAKQAICPKEPWRRFRTLLFHRAMGAYSLAEYNKHLSGRAAGGSNYKAYLAAACPGSLANLVVVLYYVLFRRTEKLILYDVLRSRHTSWLCRLLIHVAGVRVQ